jgi:hypothetical protein
MCVLYIRLFALSVLVYTISADDVRPRVTKVEGAEMELEGCCLCNNPNRERLYLLGTDAKTALVCATHIRRVPLVERNLGAADVCVMDDSGEHVFNLSFAVIGSRIPDLVSRLR